MGSGEENASSGSRPQIADFLADPPRDRAAWRWLWEQDQAFPIRSDRPFLGGLLVLFKRLLRPFVKVPQQDLWDRQRAFNLIVLEWLEDRARTEQVDRLADRVGHLEGGLEERTAMVLRHNDALFARLDQKVDLYRRQARDLSETLGGALAALESGAQAAPPTAGAPSPAAALLQVQEEQGYLELERRYRGTEAEIAERLSIYLPRLAGHGPVLDLGCGRGESLALLAAHGIEASGIDASLGMVAQCRKRGLVAEQADLFSYLAGRVEGSLGAVVSFHVIEHLPAPDVDRLVRLAWRALRPGGLLILETPNPLSVVVAARNFWLDPTHRRPIHPESLELSCRLAGFEPVERLELRPFPATERLPEIDPASLAEAARPLAQHVNELRDRLDDLLFGCQDYAVLAEKPQG